MSPKLPIKLEGSNLGARHRYLNSLVNNALTAGESIEDILNLPEQSHIDRLYKIDLASKHKHLQYIIKSLQDDDMLFVSRALKSTWLLDEEHIINPPHLEAVLFPQMLTTAVTKMKNWISLHLQNPLRCQQFYEYYLEKNSDYAFKFLNKCPEDIILLEFPKKATINKITPQKLKVLCEKIPKVAKIFYDMSSTDKTIRDKINNNADNYFDSVKCVLKDDPDIFLDIIEKYFTSNIKKISATQTKFVLMERKDRFMLKAEFYTSHILNVGAIAQCLTPVECENLVIRLARAQYLDQWFSYKNIEPFVKRLDVDNRASFKKKVFVDKNVGDMILKCPYDVPKFLRHFTQNNDFDYIDDCGEIYEDPKGVFLYEYQSNTKYDYISDMRELYTEMCLMGARCEAAYSFPKKTTYLDALFDEYRFSSFDKTLFELRKKIKSESSSQNRMNMFLVLVSKSGGKAENLRPLFSLLVMHKNEPSHVRAAVIRTLVKRVSVWRVADDIWANLQAFGQGLGLDGSTPDADCIEGLHAVVIRTLVSKKDCEPAVTAAYLKNFSTFHDYNLTTSEKEVIKKALLKLLINYANIEKDTNAAVQILDYAIDTIEQYKIKFSTQPELLTSITNILKNDIEAGKGLIKRLFSSKLGRKELFRENFEIVQTDASYVNALKHDANIITVDKFIKAITIDNMNAEQFMRKLSIYFIDNSYLSLNLLAAMKQTKMYKKLARPITYLSGKDLLPYILELDGKDDQNKRFSARIRANAHIARPALSINKLDWKTLGAKFIANRFISCKAKDIDVVIKQLLSWKKTARLATVLAQRTAFAPDVYAEAAKLKPTATLKSGLLYFRRLKDQSDTRIWNVIKPLITTIKSLKTSPHLLYNIRDSDSIPSSMQAEYLVEAYKAIGKVDYDKSMSLLSRIKNIISKVDAIFIEEVLLQFLQNRFIFENNPIDDKYYTILQLHLNILIKYLLFSKTEDIQNERFKNVGQLYLDRLKSYRDSTKNTKKFFNHVHVITYALRDTEVFTNIEYASSLPVMEKIEQWMQSVISVEENFAIFVPLHLIMLYCKAIRQTAELKPGIFQDIQRYDDAYAIVGEKFGQFIAQEARTLSKTYFDSIVILYSFGLSYFCGHYDNKNWRKVEPFIIKSIVKESNGIECTLGLQLFDEIKQRSYIKKSVENDLQNCLKQKDLAEMQFCLGAWERPVIDNYNSFMRHVW